MPGQSGSTAAVLIVEDEPNILELLTASLELSGFHARGAGTGAKALEVAAEWRPDIVVLDVMLPDLDGFAVAQRLRAAAPDLPVLFLTARDGVADRVAGLRAGADDYVTKPFSLEEVVLRITAILRRTRSAAPAPECLRYADLELDEGLREVRRAGRPVRLSPTEFNLLRYLLVNAESVVSKSQIMDRVWGQDAGDSRVVESYISYLRRKIDTGAEPLIRTVWGIGYTLRRSATPAGT
ncbi:response regulator transcription factor [Nocardiopsis ansamitocini]|uniref:DNA-binding response regulator n=1 Tax=Nocardiopsis ansamitocini TaxID=1670832 RepID=A0A9W6PA18_9ACTN|nr:response regulator transcription factor [Nocardiopsis ansamitocini]GLU49905.1 DNA-binding response regulator [Nocardiopsis ansamitocini]